MVAARSLLRDPEGTLSQLGAIVDSPHFILATRDTGYRSLAAAMAELIDNAIQANARGIKVFVHENVAEGGHPQSNPDVTIAVLDDGVGMDHRTLWTALQFGGTARFGDRSGIGRYGMGLPNSSVSQARRVEVYAWRRATDVLFSYLDVDEVAQGLIRGVPPPAHRHLPFWVEPFAAETGTLVIWTKCDRLDFRRARTIAQKLRWPLGRIYRHLIWGGTEILINNEPIEAIDPLLSDPNTGEGGAQAFGPPLKYEIALPGGNETSTVRVRFTELPVALWRDLSVEEKRTRGIVGGAGVSFVRARREIDYGWQLMGSKRKENYDDWWRCEVSFDPRLDEFFGVTHSKQGVVPTLQLQMLLSPDLEAAARTLNSRVRASFDDLKPSNTSRATHVAARQEVLLPPALPVRASGDPAVKGLSYAIRTAKLRDRAFFSFSEVDQVLTVTLNVDHPFFERIYSPALAARDDKERYALECLILSAARAELSIQKRGDRACLERYRAAWGDVLAAFLERRV